jgi:CubicO group peptidase (beta-lactamase class C family)
MAKRRRSARDRQTRFLGIMTAALAVVFIVAFKSEDIESESAEEVLPTKELNKEIRNEMSEVPELKDLDKKISRYMREWHLKGGSLAITRNDSLVYAKGYGWADQELEIAMEPGHIMRVASVSKLITAAGIMVLQDQGKLTIKDKVFGPEGLLNDEHFNELIQCDPRYLDMTVEDIMRHRSCFISDQLFRSKEVQAYMGLKNPPTKDDFFTLVFRNKLRAAPGTITSYSNFGYLVLSEIIERVSGMPYEKFIQKHVMKPAGCYDMHIGGVYYSDKRDNEVRYYTQEGEGKYVPDFRNPQDTVESCYGKNNIPLLSGAGAWCSSTVELARFVASIDGDPHVKDIITKESFEQMTEPTDDRTFGLGWNDTHPVKGWNRTGTLDGTSALIRHYPDGECWIFVTNTGTYKGPRFTKETDALFTECRRLYSSKLPKVDLFVDDYPLE